MKSDRQQPNDLFLTLKIERIVPDGYGIGFADGPTIFVPLTAPNDLVKVRLERKKGKIAFASIVEILEPSPDRIAPPCPYFGRCGGCDFQQLNYRAQLDAKIGIIKDALRRIGKIEWQDEIKIFESPNQWNYRTRVQWKRNANKFGYFERNSHEVIDVDVCPILAPQLQNELSRQRENQTNSVEIQAVASDTEVSTRTGRASEVFDENFYAANTEASDKELEISVNKTAAKEIRQTIGEFEYAFNAATFFQVNHLLLEQFVETVINGSNGNLALDLYCGVGLFSLPLAKRFEIVLAVEGNAQSIKFARANAQTANLLNVQFETAWVGDWLANTDKLKASPDLVLLDPPRTGAERETIESLIKLAPAQIIYVSCNPATLARDLQLLTENYKIIEITAFDFFPQTHHVETVVRLIPRNAQTSV